MSHFARIDKNNIVQEVIKAEQNFINSGVVGDSFEWIQCSYNKNFRGIFPSTGSLYLKNRDIFINPCRYDSWILDEENAKYKAPKDKPEDGKDYFWSEEDLDWVERKTESD